MTSRTAVGVGNKLIVDLNTPHLNPADVLAEKLAEARERRGQQRRVVSRGRMSFEEFVRSVPEQRGPLDLERFAFQKERVDAHAAEDGEQVTEKATQVGESTLSVRLGLYHAGIRHHVVVYTFPTDDEITKFSQQRIKPIVRASDLVQSMMAPGAVDNATLKQVGAGWMYFFGLQKPIDSVPADLVIFDEYNTSDQANVEASERRVSGPMSANMIRRLGVPSHPNFGITKFYEESDARVWTVKCTACGMWNHMHGYDGWEHNVDKDTATVVCRRHGCRRPLDVRLGQWVPRHPDRSIRGYHIPKYIVHGANLRSLVRNSQKTDPAARREFFNRDLAQAWDDVENRLSLDQIRACAREGLCLQERADPTAALRTMGIDLASERAFNVVVEEAVSEYVGVRRWIGRVEGDAQERFQKLCWLMDAFHIHMAGIDHAPDGLFAKAFAARYPGRVFRCSYFTPRMGQRDPPSWRVDQEDRFIGLSRSVAIAATLERFRLQRVLLPNLDLLPEGYVEELGNVVREVVETRGGNKRIDYRHIGPADYAHAEVYNYAAIEAYWLLAGIARAQGEGPVPLAHGAEYVGGALSSYDAPPRYA